jgi:multidrug efflux pump subunit AcrB
MWIVKLALSRPYTFIVLSLVLLLISPVMLLRTPVDIFPAINIPVISVIWTYTGLPPSEMESRIVSRRFRAPPCRSRTAEKSGRSWSTSTRTV